MPYLADLSPEWRDIDTKTLNRKILQHTAFFRIIDKYAKKVPAQDLLDAELKEWKQQKGASAYQAEKSEDLSWLSSDDGKEEQESIQEKAAEETPKTKYYKPP